MSEFSFWDHYSFQILSYTFLPFWSLTLPLPSCSLWNSLHFFFFFLYFLRISCFQALRIHSVRQRQLQIIYKSLITENYNEQLPLITTNSRPSQSHWDSDAKPQMPWRPTVTSTADLASSKACNLLEKQKNKNARLQGWKSGYFISLRQWDSIQGGCVWGGSMEFNFYLTGVTSSRICS